MDEEFGELISNTSLCSPSATHCRPFLSMSLAALKKNFIERFSCVTARPPVSACSVSGFIRSFASSLARAWMESSSIVLLEILPLVRGLERSRRAAAAEEAREKIVGRSRRSRALGTGCYALHAKSRIRTSVASS